MKKNDESFTFSDIVVIALLVVLIILLSGEPDLLDAIIARVGAA